MFAKIFQVFSPAFYKQTFANIVKNTHKDMVAGSVKPLFKGMLLVGVCGYAMEYQMVGSKLIFRYLKDFIKFVLGIKLMIYSLFLFFTVV